jgi:formylglycine-generating enzyme required for sulfatase activity
MFDGIDEVSQNEREDVRAAVDGFARLPDQRHHFYIVTSRPSTAHIADTLTDFERANVQPLTANQRAKLIELWCDAVYATPDEAARENLKLTRRIEDPRVREIADTPLMVNIFALTYYYKKELPSQRAELYEFAIQTLLSDLHRPDRASIKDWGGFDVPARRDHLALIAFILHDANINNIRVGELLEHEVFWRRFGTDKEVAQDAAQVFLELAARRGGLLRQDGNRFDFYLRRFREFLAARWVAKKLEEQWQAVLNRHLEDDQWEEPILLGVGFLAFDDLDKADKYMRLLLDSLDARTPTQDAYAVALAGVALADLSKHGDKSVQAKFERLKQSLPVRMATVLEENPPLLRLELRRDLGLALSAVGDPRLSPSAMPDLIRIPVGPFRMGTNARDAELLKAQGIKPYDDELTDFDQIVYVSDFDIGKYPVTDAEFRAFHKAKGYDQQKYWSNDGWLWRTGKLEPNLEFYAESVRKSVDEWLRGRPVEKRSQPFYWDDPQWNAPNLPIVGVTWYEAEAYCNWLTATLRASGALQANQEIRLPTEAEWEKAARGGARDLRGLEDLEGMRYLWPWGDAWDKDKCNSSESGLNSTTPVGMYPDGTWRDENGKAGPLDMVGNVWEWCGDWYEKDYYKSSPDKNPRGSDSGQMRVVRGGSWFLNHSDCRAASRLRDLPALFNNTLGFRVVRSPVSWIRSAVRVV